MAIRYKALTELYQETQLRQNGSNFLRLPAATTGFHLMNNCLSMPSARTLPPSWRSSDGTSGSDAG